MWVSEQARHSPSALSVCSPGLESSSACVPQRQCPVLGVVRAWQRNLEKILDASQVYVCAVGNSGMCSLGEGRMSLSTLCWGQASEGMVRLMEFGVKAWRGREGVILLECSLHRCPPGCPRDPEDFHHQHQTELDLHVP